MIMMMMMMAVVVMTPMMMRIRVIMMIMAVVVMTTRMMMTDMGEVTSILITAEMELSITSTIVSSVGSILENRKKHS